MGQFTNLGLEDRHKKRYQKRPICSTIIMPLGVWKQQASGNCTTLPPATEENPSKQRLAMARHTTDAEKTLYRVGGLPHDADAASPKRSKVPLNYVR
jgi:hypothetical protein